MSSVNFQKSFGEWCKENGKELYLDYWQNNLNGCSPYDVSYKSSKRFAFWCGNPNHPIFYKQPSNVTCSKTDRICPACESFGQYVIDEFGEEYLNKIWSDKNTFSPFTISKADQTHKIWLRCEKNEKHPDYEALPGNFRKGSRCPYCAGLKVCPDNSLGHMIPEICNIWSDKNEKSPYEYPQSSDSKVWLKCSNGIHEDFQRRIGNIKYSGYECPECVQARVANERSEDLTGQIFGRLTVIGQDPNDSKKCICECGCENHTMITVPKIRLKTGKTTSCGCYKKELHSGVNSRWWKGGITEHNQEGRYTQEYREWRKSVFERDNYTCQCCGKRGNGELEAHHILNYSDNEELRYDPLNGITLCHECHSQNTEGGFHKIYGTSNNTPEQLEEYINARRKELNIEETFSYEEYLNQSKEREKMNHKRTCSVCGKIYEYCPTCSSFKGRPKWMALFDKQICKDVFDIVSAYNTDSLSVNEAKAKLMELDLSDATFKDSVQSKINEIMSTGEVEESTLETLHDEPCEVVESKADLDSEIVNGFSSEPISEPESCEESIAEPEEEVPTFVAESEETMLDPANYDLDLAIEAEKDEEATLKPHRVHKHKAKFRADENNSENNNDDSDVNSIN